MIKRLCFQCRWQGFDPLLGKSLMSCGQKKKNKERERETVSNVLTLPSQSGTSAVCSVKDGLDCAAKNVGRKKGEE